EVNVATGAYDVRYGNALSGVVEVKLKEGSERFAGGLTSTTGNYGTRTLQGVLSGPDPIWKPMLGRVGVKLPGLVTSIVDVSGTLFETRFHNVTDIPGRPRLHSSYEDSFFGYRFNYGEFFSPSEDNRWAGRYGLTWKPSERDKWSLNFSKRIAIDQGFSRVILNA